MFRWILLVAAALSASAASAADTIRYAPPADWVRATTIPQIPDIKDGSPVQTLLVDSQARFGADHDDFYGEFAVRILTPQGLASNATVPISWSPDTESVTIHRMVIIRDGKSIDLLAGGKNVTVLRREGKLELSMLDGRLTASVQPEGLRVGDIVDMAMTVERHDPVFQGHSQNVSVLRFPGVVGRVRIRALWPATKPVVWRASEGFPKPTLSHPDGGTELLVDSLDLTAPKPPQDAPERFSHVGELEFSQFQSWAEVSALMAPLYAKAATLAPDSPIRAEAAKIRAASSDPKTRAQMALRLVQDQTHYVALAMNFGGYIPADADQTWSRRFGDCKGKTALLLALLREAGVEAQAALVNTADGDSLPQRLPMLNFDHVFVRAKIAGKVYWLDGTRPDDRDLDDIQPPDFRWVLPVQAAGAKLEQVQRPPLSTPAFESIKRIDATAGYDGVAKAHMEQIYRGDAAYGWKTILNALGEADAQRRLKEFWRGQAPWMEPRTVSFAYDDAKRVMRLLADGDGKLDWLHNQNVREHHVDDSELGFNQSFKREPGPNADAPIWVPYPEFNRWTVTLILPAKGVGFHLVGAGDVNDTIAGRHYLRTSKLEDGVITMTAEMRTLAPEFPFSEAEAASAKLRDLAAMDVVARGLGGASSEPAPAEDGMPPVLPTDAVGLSARGAAYLARRDYDHAIEDFSAAAKLQPTEAKHVYNRGVARYSKRDDVGALADFDMAIHLNPKDSLPYAARAELMIQKGDGHGAIEDLDEAVKLAPSNIALLARRFQVLEKLRRYVEALRDVDALLAATPATAPPGRRAALLNSRCWVRGLLGQNLSTALADCDAALALVPNTAAILDSKGFVELRMKQYDKALADYDAALRISPKQAASLYGRALVKFAKGGAVAGAKADLLAARAIAPMVALEFNGAGLKPPPGF